jgi:hypothetical protein
MIDHWNDNFAVLDSLGLLDEKQVNESENRPEKSPDMSRHDQVSTQELASRLESIKKRITKLRAVFSTSLSAEISRELDRWQARAHDLATVLLDRDPAALYQVISDDVDFFLTPPRREARPRIPLAAQQMIELAWELRQQPVPRPPESNSPINFGSGAFLR